MNTFQKFPCLLEISFESINLASNKIIGKNFNFKSSFEEQGFDTFNVVEFIMELEKHNNIQISDEIGEEFMNGTIHFGNLFISLFREEQLNKLIND